MLSAPVQLAIVTQCVASRVCTPLELTASCHRHVFVVESWWPGQVRCNASDFCLLPFCWSSTAATAYLHIRSFAATFCPSSTAFADACADFGNIDCYHRCTPSNVVWQACLVTSPSLSLLRSPRLALLFDNARGLRAGLFLPEEWVSGFHSCSMYSEIGKHAYLFWVSTMQVRLLSFAYNLPLYSRATAPSKHL